ncbi:unnamed protein product, partial [Hapterophycus canaliculatus]
PCPPTHTRAQTTVVPEDKTGVLKDAAAVAGDKLVLTFERDAFIQLELFGLTTLQRQTIPVPGIGSIGGVSADKKYDHIMFKFTNFVVPGTIYHGTVSSDGVTGAAEVGLKVYLETKVPGINTGDFETKQV